MLLLQMWWRWTLHVLPVLIVRSLAIGRWAVSDLLRWRWALRVLLRWCWAVGVL